MCDRIKMSAERFRKLRPGLKETSINTYVANVRRLRKVDKHLDYGPIASYLKQMSASKAVTLLTALIVLEGRHRFGRLYDGLVEDANRMRGNQQFTKTELANWTSSLEIRKGIKRCRFDVDKAKLLEPRVLKSHEFATLQHYLVLKFYNEFHWRSDLVSIRLGHHPGKNYYKNGVLYMNKFKTDKQFARRGMLPLRFTPSRGLKILLRKFIHIRSLQPKIDHDYLIVNKSWRPIARHSFYQYMVSLTQKYIGKRLGTSMLRHVYITEFLDSDPNLNTRKKFLYSTMQLSLETQEGYRRIH